MLPRSKKKKNHSFSLIHAYISFDCFYVCVQNYVGMDINWGSRKKSTRGKCEVLGEQQDIWDRKEVGGDGTNRDGAGGEEEVRRKDKKKICLTML